MIPNLKPETHLCLKCDPFKHPMLDLQLQPT